MKYSVKDINLFFDKKIFFTEVFNDYVNIEIHIIYDSKLFIEKYKLRLISLFFLKEEQEKNRCVSINKALVLDYFGEKDVKELIHSFLKNIIFFESIEDVWSHLDKYLIRIK